MKSLTLLLLSSASLLADWQPTGEARFTNISGKPADLAATVTLDVPPTGGNVALRSLNLLTSILPASSSTKERCDSYLNYAGRSTTAGSPGCITNKTALRLPGLLASIVAVKDSNDPRLARFMTETRLILQGMRDNTIRLGPFEIYFPIANHVAAKRLLGSILTSHPEYADYEKSVFEFQCLRADYKSNGADSPKRPIPDAKTIADVPADIDNGNFRLLVTAAGYLAAQEFPNLKTIAKHPKTGAERIFTRDEILREMGLYIRRVYHTITTRNTWEYGSQTYLAIDFAPIRMIAEHAKDPELKRIATRTLDWMYSSLAASWNQGHYITRHKLNWLGEQAGGFSPQWQNSAQPYAGRRNQLNGRIVFAFRSLKPLTKSNDPWPDKSSLTYRYDYKKAAWVIDYPVLATYPEDKAVPRILHQKDELLWLDGAGKPTLRCDFTGFLK